VAIGSTSPFGGPQLNGKVQITTADRAVQRSIPLVLSWPAVTFGRCGAAT
jgi:hypothetical protein